LTSKFKILHPGNQQLPAPPRLLPQSHQLLSAWRLNPMATPAQVAANRLNALKSTGPKSPGLAVTRFNALKSAVTNSRIQETTIQRHAGDRAVVEHDFLKHRP
jgi:hypothetical protein